jgi:hypothetical protein
MPEKQIETLVNKGMVKYFMHTTLLPTLWLVSSLNNPQSNKMKICENMKLTC